MGTLKDAIMSELEPEDPRIAEQLDILTAGAKDIDENDLQKIMSENFEGLTECSQEDIDSLKALAVYRIQNNLNIHPFAGFVYGTDPILY